jgi:hypothetical protein
MNHISPLSRVIFQKLIVSQLVKKVLSFYGIWSSMPVFTKAGTCWYPNPHESSPCLHPISWTVILILLSYLCLGLPSGSFPHISPWHLYALLLSPIRDTPRAPLIHIDSITQIIFGEDYKQWSSSLLSLFQSPVTWTLSDRNIFLIILTLEPPQPAFLPQCDSPNFIPTLNKQNYSSVHLVFASPIGCAV